MKQHKHITISDKKLCCGCSACSMVCPKTCISMREDPMGSKYPEVDTAKCIQCEACVKVCPFLNPASNIVQSIKCYAAINRNERVRMKSSSGGVFKALAQSVISSGGIVVGAIFSKDWMVEHISADSMGGVNLMMGSKYVQSDTERTYTETRNHLMAGCTVLYSGTPCQIAGLNHFLHKDYPNLITVEVICHGAPERGIWHNYLKELTAQLSEKSAGNISILPHTLKKQDIIIDEIKFRDKCNGWKNYGFTFSFAYAHNYRYDCDQTPAIKHFYEPFHDNAYMKAFLRNFSLRPSCYACQAKSGISQADMTIGDFWGIEHTDLMQDDDKGVSCVICRTEKGLNEIEKCEYLNLTETQYNVILHGNPSLEKSVSLTNEGKYFKKLFLKYGFYRALYKTEHPSLCYRGIRYIKRHIKCFK